MSRTVGWLADRRIPGPLRAPIYRTYARFTGAELADVAAPLASFPSLGAFFVRHLKPEARTVERDPGKLPSPADSMLQDLSCIEEDTILQAKGMAYDVRELLAGVGSELDLEGGYAWTLYLSPRDYHRVHAPETSRLVEVRWVPGCFYSVRPSILAKEERVFARNERAVMRLETEHGPLLMVMVGALNVARIRIIGVEAGVDLPFDPERQRRFERGAELARFEMGSTVILVSPPGGLKPIQGLHQGDTIKLGQPIADWPS